MNGGFLDPATRLLIVSARVEDVMVVDEEPGRVVITVEHLDEGIEIHHEEERLWRPA